MFKSMKKAKINNGDRYSRTGLPKALLIDIDGTLAYMTNRGPFEYRKAIDDGVFYEIVDLVDRYRCDHTIILLSGRDEECKDVTIEWLGLHDIEYEDLFMRANKDNRCDSIIKLELYKRHIQGKYDVTFVLDDRDRVVNMWRENGLKCLQVAPGSF